MIRPNHTITLQEVIAIPFLIRIPIENRAIAREGEAPAEPVRDSRVLSNPARREPRPPEQ